jgi:hypothetical protein
VHSVDYGVGIGVKQTNMTDSGIFAVKISSFLRELESLKQHFLEKEKKKVLRIQEAALRKKKSEEA